jgi:hypothetical protein
MILRCLAAGDHAGNGGDLFISRNSLTFLDCAIGKVFVSQLRKLRSEQRTNQLTFLLFQIGCWMWIC